MWTGLENPANMQAREDLCAHFDNDRVLVRIQHRRQTDRVESRELKTKCLVMDTEKFKKYYQSGPHFRIENPNPDWAKKRGFKWDRGDCSIRALANAISCEWVAAFDFLNRRARRDFNVCNDFGGFRKWVVEGGAKWVAFKAEKGKSRETVLDFAKAHPSGRYVIQIANHFTACVDGVILDAWNCGEKRVVGYFDMLNFKL